MESQQTVGLARAWMFRISLLVAALTGFLGLFVNTSDRLDLAHGIPATIQFASLHQRVPDQWTLSDDGHLRTVVDVRVTTKDGKQSFQQLYLSKEAVDAMVNKQQPEIVFVKDRPGRFLLKGEQLPPFGLGWGVLGVVSFAVFLYSLKLR